MFAPLQLTIPLLVCSIIGLFGNIKFIIINRKEDNLHSSFFVTVKINRNAFSRILRENVKRIKNISERLLLFLVALQTPLCLCIFVDVLRWVSTFSINWLPHSQWFLRDSPNSTVVSSIRRSDLCNVHCRHVRALLLHRRGNDRFGGKTVAVRDFLHYVLFALHKFRDNINSCFLAVQRQWK